MTDDGVEHESPRDHTRAMLREIGGPIFIPGVREFDSWRTTGSSRSRRHGSLLRAEVVTTAGDGEVVARVETFCGKTVEPEGRRLISAVLGGSAPADGALPISVTVQERPLALTVGTGSVEAVVYHSGTCWASEFSVGNRAVRVMVRGVPAEGFVVAEVEEPGSLPDSRLGHHSVS